MYSVAHIRHTLDTRDEFYETEIAYLQDTLPTLGAAEVALSEAIAASPFRSDIEQEFGKQYFVSIDLQKKLFCEANIPLRQQESRLTNEYQKIMATAEIPFDGKTLNLYGVQKYFEHPDRAVRAAAVKAYSKFYEEQRAASGGDMGRADPHPQPDGQKSGLRELHPRGLSGAGPHGLRRKGGGVLPRAGAHRPGAAVPEAL